MAHSSHEQYLTVRTDYLARERAASERVDQVLLAGAGGALALSLAFIEKIAPNPQARTMWLLGLSWISLLASLAAALLGYELRSRAYALARRKLDEVQDPAKIDMKAIDRYNRVLTGLGVLSLGTLLVGVLLLVTFAFRNIKTS